MDAEWAEEQCEERGCTAAFPLRAVGEKLIGQECLFTELFEIHSRALLRVILPVTRLLVISLVLLLTLILITGLLLPSLSVVVATGSLIAISTLSSGVRSVLWIERVLPLVGWRGRGVTGRVETAATEAAVWQVGRDFFAAIWASGSVIVINISNSILYIDGIDAG